ncbi:hypothetical protein K1728_05340 [Weissella confusa]|uniref:hypothetical protein n=1 Tax=Weissella confusa TaxID=1583 RepID=UPI001C6FA636|nr:hypothetical protein [Weissella confusa]QYU58823.1 hypothetical protein K1728_05340 [Weissella confusa]
MKIKGWLILMSSLLIALVYTFSVTGTKQVEISQVQHEIKQVRSNISQKKQQFNQEQTQLPDNQVQAQQALVTFAQVYYTFASQTDYLARFTKLADGLALPTEQQSQLFDSGLDETGGSRIDNLGLKSQYDSGNTYAGELNDDSVPVYAVVTVKTSSTGQSPFKQKVFLQADYNVNSHRITRMVINQIQL